MNGVYPRKTYWHLQSLQKRPDEYDIATTRLLHDEGRMLDVDAPVLPWYDEHARQSFLYREPLEGFEDPRRTTYRRYTEVQHAKEHFVDGLFSAIDATDYDSSLPSAWLDVLEAVLPALRYPVHGLQMASAYVAHVAPSGRLVTAGVFQCGNELRRIQCLARRVHQLRQVRSDFGADARERWQDAPAWQPLRALIEKLLVTYDFSEATIALQVVVKPMFDHLFVRELARTASREGDPLLGKLLYSLDTDCAFQREVTTALFAPLLGARPELRANVEALRAPWAEQARAAVLAALRMFAGAPEQYASAALELDAFCEGYWQGLGCMPARPAGDGGRDGTRVGA